MDGCPGSRLGAARGGWQRPGVWPFISPRNQRQRIDFDRPRLAAKSIRALISGHEIGAWSTRFVPIITPADIWPEPDGQNEAVVNEWQHRTGDSVVEGQVSCQNRAVVNGWTRSRARGSAFQSPGEYLAIIGAG